MNLWNTRQRSKQWLNDELAPEWEAIKEGFRLIDTAIEGFDAISEAGADELQGRFGRVCGLAGTKARVLLHCCLSLTLDAHAQESGALLRPLVEAIELLTYVRLDPKRAEDLIEGNKPKAGAIAKAIEGHFHSLRQHLNEHAAHLGFSHHALGHLLDQQSLRFKPAQTHDLQVFGVNLSVINAFQYMAVVELGSCLFAGGVNASELAEAIETWRGRCTEVFARHRPPSSNKDA